MEKLQAVAKVTKLFGPDRNGGVVLVLYDTFPEEFDPAGDPLFARIDALPVPLWCERFERRGVAGALAAFADLDTAQRASELVGHELYVEGGEPEPDDAFYMEDLIGFSVDAAGRRGVVTEYYDSDANPLFGITFDGREYLVPAVGEFVTKIDFDGRRMTMSLPEGLLALDD